MAPRDTASPDRHGGTDLGGWKGSEMGLSVHGCTHTAVRRQCGGSYLTSPFRPPPSGPSAPEQTTSVSTQPTPSYSPTTQCRSKSQASLSGVRASPSNPQPPNADIYPRLTKSWASGSHGTLRRWEEIPTSLFLFASLVSFLYRTGIQGRKSADHTCLVCKRMAFQVLPISG